MSQKLDPGQLDFLEGLDQPGKDEASGAGDAAEAPRERPARRRTAKERRPRLPEHLPVEELVIEPEPVKACPEAWRRIGEEVSEELDYQPGRFLRRRIVRPK